MWNSIASNTLFFSRNRVDETTHHRRSISSANLLSSALRARINAINTCCQSTGGER